MHINHFINPNPNPDPNNPNNLLETNNFIGIQLSNRVDSPGHSGLLGSGSTLDVDRNLVLDTQIVQVCKLISSLTVVACNLSAKQQFLMFFSVLRLAVQMQWNLNH